MDRKNTLLRNEGKPLLKIAFPSKKKKTIFHLFGLFMILGSAYAQGKCSRFYHCFPILLNKCNFKY